MDQVLKRPAFGANDTGCPPILPDTCRCEMPEQSLWRHRPRKTPAPARALIARVVLVVLWLAASAAFAWTLYRVLSVEAPTVLQLVFLVLSTLCFSWVAAGSVSALIGFVTLATTRSIDTLQLPPARLPPNTRT